MEITLEDFGLVDDENQTILDSIILNNCFGDIKYEIVGDTVRVLFHPIMPINYINVDFTIGDFDATS